MSVKDIQLILPELELTEKMVIQVGSQNGIEAEYLADNGFNVFCIDPEPLHKPRANVNILIAAASDKAGIAYLYRANGINSLDDRYVRDWRGKPVGIEYSMWVATVRLCDLNLKPNLVVIDAEGADHNVLRGLFGGEHKPEVVMFEMTKTYPDRCQDGLDTLRWYGYHKFLTVFHCGDDILDVQEFDGRQPLTFKNDVDWFANIIAKLDPGPWKLNDIKR